MPALKQIISVPHSHNIALSRKLAREVKVCSESEARLALLRQNGFVRMDGVLDHQLLQELDEYAWTSLEKAKADLTSGKTTIKNWEVVGKAQSYPPGHILQKIATHPTLLKLVAKHFGSVPLINYAILTHSTECGVAWKVSQLWHRDADDTKVVKFFCYLNEVDQYSGPFHLIPREDSKKIHGDLFFRHHPDEKIFKCIDRRKVETFSGNKFSSFLVETGKCYHMGGRIIRPDRERMMLTVAYTSYPSLFNVNHGFAVNSEQTPLVQLALAGQILH